MRADKAGGRHNPSGSLRTSQPSTTKLSDSDKLMGSVTRTPESPQGGEYVEFELPSDGTGSSLSVRPASGQAKQVIGDLSRFSNKLRNSHESQFGNKLRNSYESQTNSLRTSQTRTAKLSESDKLMGSLTRTPESPQGGEYVEFELPADGTENPLPVRPSSGQAKQFIGDLSRLDKKLRGSQESQTKKRTQSQADIGEEDGDSQGLSKRQRTEDTTNPHASTPGSAHGNPIRQPVRPIITPPDLPIGMQPAPQPIARPIAQPIAQRLDVLAETALAITPDIQASTAIDEALRMANSITPFQPEKISELFQHLCRSQLWHLLKLEEQRVMYLMNIYAFLPVTSEAAIVASAGSAVPGNIPSSSSSSSSSSSTTTTTTTMQPVSLTAIPLAGIANAVVQGAPLPNPQPTNRTPVPIIRTTPAASGSNASKVTDHLLPKPPNPPSLHYARSLLAMLPENVRHLMNMPADEITTWLRSQTLEFETINNMTAFTCYLVEAVSHGGLPHLTGELDGIVNVLLDYYRRAHRQLENKNRGAPKAIRAKTHTNKNPAHAYTLRLLPKYPQFTRLLGNGINNLSETHRKHLAFSRKFNHVLDLIRDRRALAYSDEEFNKRLDDIIGHVSAPESSSRTSTTSTPVSTPTSMPFKPREDEPEEGSDGAI